MTTATIIALALIVAMAFGKFCAVGRGNNKRDQ